MGKNPESTESRNEVLRARVVYLVKSCCWVEHDVSEKWPMDLGKWGLLISLIKAGSEALMDLPGLVLPSFPSPPGHWALAISNYWQCLICHLPPFRREPLFIFPDGGETPPLIKPSLC